MEKEPKLELVTTKRRLDRLSLVKQRAITRTKQRISQMLEEQKLRAAEAELSKPAVEDKKGK